MEKKHSIVIPVVGYESAGKSSLIDALIGGEYTETSSIVCTRSIYRFRLYDKRATTSSSDDGDDSAKFDGIASIHQTIHESNNDQSNNPNEVVQLVLSSKQFDIKLRSPLCNEMMKNVGIEIIDLPGWKEGADTTCPSKEYVKDHWDTFGCVIVVLDVTQNNEEARRRHRSLLQSLKDLNKMNHVKIIVVGNKVDNMESSEVLPKTMMKEDVAAVFGEGSDAVEDFVSISAKVAFYYRCAAELSFDAFVAEYGPRMDKIKEEIFSFKDRAKKTPADTYHELKDEETVRLALSTESSNFQGLLDVVNRRVGGTGNQKRILKNVQLSKLHRMRTMEVTRGSFWDTIGCIQNYSTKPDWIECLVEYAEVCRSIHEEYHVMFEESFMIIHSNLLGEARKLFESCMNLEPLGVCMVGVVDMVTNSMQWNGREPKSWSDHIKKIKHGIVKEYFAIIRARLDGHLRKSEITNGKKRKQSDGTCSIDSWCDMTSQEWTNVIWTLRNEVPNFCHYFPQMGRFLDTAKEELNLRVWNKRIKNNNGSNAFILQSMVSSPPSTSYTIRDPGHWGYIPFSWIEKYPEPLGGEYPSL